MADNHVLIDFTTVIHIILVALHITPLSGMRAQSGMRPLSGMRAQSGMRPLSGMRALSQAEGK